MIVSTSTLVIVGTATGATYTERTTAFASALQLIFTSPDVQVGVSEHRAIALDTYTNREVEASG